MICSENTAALIASYIAQGEIVPGGKCYGILFFLYIGDFINRGRSGCNRCIFFSIFFTAEIGDFIIEEYRDYKYLMVLGSLVPNQTEEMLKKVAEYHKQHM